jgi:hypothetical protein
MRIWFPFLIACAALALFHGVVVFSELFPHPTWEHGGFEFWTVPAWDENWYCRIADLGYQRDVPSYRSHSSLVFSPGFPMLLRAAHFVVGFSVEVVRLPVAAALFTVACVVMWRILQLCFPNEDRNRWILALFAFSPGSMYFLTGYAEALYLPLLLLFFAALLRKRHLAAAVIASLALFTRSPAIILVVTLCVAVLVEHLRSSRPGVAVLRTAGSLALYLPICAVGLLGYMYMTYVEVGDPFAFVKSYVAWFPVEQSRVQTLALGTPVRAVYEGWRCGTPSLLASGIALAVLPPLVFTHRTLMPLSFVAFSGFAWIFFLYQNPPIEDPVNVLRWLAPVFPLHVSLVLFTERLGRGRVVANTFLLALFLVLYAINVYRFIHSQWVS